jgi:sugar phosphate isomerase/epimerase
LPRRIFHENIPAGFAISFTNYREARRHMNRRTFLSSSTIAVTGSLLAAGFNEISARTISKVGVQLYTVRDQMKNDLEGTIASIAALGYKEVEFAGYYNRTPQQIGEILKKNGLTAPSTHMPINALRDDLNKTVETAAAVGHKFLICPYLMEPERKTMDQYKQHAALFNKAGEACKKAGIQFGYHNHDFEFLKFDGQIPMDVLLAETDPKLVQIELDLYWITKAGHDPLAYFARHPGRFPLVHVKDMDKTPKQFFTEVGRGSIDFKKIFAQSKKAGIKHYFVEQDMCPGNPLDSLKISVDYLRKLTF